MNAIYFYMDEEVEGRAPCWVLSVSGNIHDEYFEFTIESPVPVTPEHFAAEWANSPIAISSEIGVAIDALLRISYGFNITFCLRRDATTPLLASSAGGAE